MEKASFNRPSIGCLDHKLDTFFLDLDQFRKESVLAGRIHAAHCYVYRCSKDKLGDMLKDVNASLKEFDEELIEMLNDGHKIFKKYQQELKYVESRLDYMELLLVVCLVNLHTYKKDYSVDEIEQWVHEHLESTLIEKNRFNSLTKIYETFEVIKDEFFYFNLNREIESFCIGESRINTHAVYCVLLSMERILKMAHEAFIAIKEEDNKHTRRALLQSSFKLSTFFDFIYSAMLADKKAVFWKKKPCKDLEQMFEHFDFEEPVDIDQHIEETEKAIKNFDFTVAVASKGLSSSSLIKQLFNGVRFLYKYRKDDERATKRAKFFMTVFKEETVLRMMRISENDVVKSQLKKGLQKIMLDKKIYIPFSEEDLITESNLDDDSYPLMLSKDMDLACKFDKSGYDPKTSVKVRIISHFDWDRIDWKRKKLHDPVDDPAITNIIIHIHGGGFIGGSSASSRATTIEYCTKTATIVFSIDYRLSPDYKFPDALNDCWQAYCWIIKYSEKYLQLKPKKIILMGDSAGGNLCLGITNLAILKGVRKPTGVHLLYPSLMVSAVHISPSFLLSLDDNMLNSTFLKMVLDSYGTENMLVNNHFLLSPGITPDHIIAEYPPLRLMIAGLDPLRDDQISFMLKLTNNNVNVKAILFEYLMHAFMGQHEEPVCIEEAKRAVDKSIYWVQELLEY